MTAKLPKGRQARRAEPSAVAEELEQLGEQLEQEVTIPSTPVSKASSTSGAVPVLSPKKNKRSPMFMRVLFIALLLAVGVVLWSILIPSTGPRSDRYQMVYLDDGKVFFGKLKSTSGDYLRLEHAYSVRNSDLPADATAEQKAAAGSNVALIEVGDLVYGPENRMMIRAEKVSFWQDLKTDSKISKAIDQAEQKK